LRAVSTRPAAWVLIYMALLILAAKLDRSMIEDSRSRARSFS
jgi:hypothetical protein